MMSGVRCIYCGRSAAGKPSKAHIFPVSVFGEHEYLTLNEGEVCRVCNGRTADIERKFKRQLGLIALSLGEPTGRHGRPKRVEGHGLLAVADPIDPWIFLNLSNSKQQARDHTIVPPSGSRQRVRLVNFSIDPVGSARLAFEQETIITKAFLRVLAKIGFETLCWDHGFDFCLQPRFDALREYIIEGKGRRAVLMAKEVSFTSVGEAHVTLPVRVGVRAPRGSFGHVAAIQLGAPFLVDLSGEGSYVANAYARADAELKSRVLLLGFKGESASAEYEHELS